MSRDYTGIVEKKLCTLSDRSFCSLTGRGAAALYALLKVMKKDSGPGKIIVPAIICPSVPNAVVFSGYNPVFCDVNRSDLNASAESISALLKTDKTIKGIIAVDLYGHPCDLDTIARVSREHDIFMIEDVAQALGGSHRNKPLGSYGDAAIMSFGHTKIIDKAQAGAVLTNDENLMNSVKHVLTSLPPYSPALENRKQLYTKVYYALQPLIKDDHLDELFTPIPSIFKDIYLYTKDRNRINAEAKIIDAELEHLSDYVEQRRKNAGYYRSLMVHSDIIHPEYPVSEGVPWRYCVLIKKRSRELTDHLRSCGFDVSNWYPPVYRWYKTGQKPDAVFFRNADFIGSHIVNFWTEPSMPKHEIENISRETIHYLNTVPDEEGL